MSLDPRALSLSNNDRQPLKNADIERRLRALEALAFSTNDRLVGCSLRVTDGTNPVAGNYAWTAIGLGDERLDTNGGHAAGSSDWTVPTSGWYAVSVMGCWSNSNTAGDRGVRVLHVDSGYAIVDECRASAALFTQHGKSALRYYSQGNTLRFEAQLNGAGAIVPHVQGAGADGSGMDVYLVRAM
jgi:hypothetical protein